MGNRGTVVFTDGKGEFSPAVYLHWNGGPESVYGFLEELDRRQVRADQDYECARFIQLIGEFFDQKEISGLSLGVANGPKSDNLTDLAKIQTDLGDNGLYLVNRTNGKTKVRRFAFHWNKKQDVYLTEVDETSVAREKKAADGHKYRREFREFFAKATEGKKISAY